MRVSQVTKAWAALAFALAAPVSASAQQWSAQANVGRVRASLDPAAARSSNAMLGLLYNDATAAFAITAGVPTASQEPLWGALSGTKRLALHKRGLVAGFDLFAHGFLLHDRVERTREVPDLFGRPRVVPANGLSGSALAGQAMPVLGYEAGAFQAYARAGASRYSGEFAGQQHTRTVRLADIQLMLTPSAQLAILPVVRRYDTDEADYDYAGVTGIVGQGPVNLWATTGQWLDYEGEAFTWAVGATVRVNPRITLSTSARRDTFDPLYLNPPQKSWSMGVSVHGPARQLPGAPVPAVYESGRATVRLSASGSPRQPSIAGDFNGWKPQVMQKAGGDWIYTIALAPGVYNYAFVSDRGEWFVPEKHPGRKDDGMGGHVAILVVQ